jgi:hypothetical protein
VPQDPPQTCEREEPSLARIATSTVHGLSA